MHSDFQLGLAWMLPYVECIRSEGPNFLATKYVYLSWRPNLKEVGAVQTFAAFPLCQILIEFVWISLASNSIDLPTYSECHQFAKFALKFG